MKGDFTIIVKGSCTALLPSLHATRNHFHSNELIFWLSSQTIIDKLLLTGLVCELSRQNMDFYNLLITTREIFAVHQFLSQLCCDLGHKQYPAPPPYTAPAPAPAPVNRIISPGAGQCRAGRGGFVNTATFVNTIMAKVPTRSGWKLLFVQPQIENIILVINMSSLKIYIYLQHSNVCQCLWYDKCNKA